MNDCSYCQAAVSHPQALTCGAPECRRKLRRAKEKRKLESLKARAPEHFKARFRAKELRKRIRKNSALPPICCSECGIVIIGRPRTAKTCSPICSRERIARLRTPAIRKISSCRYCETQIQRGHFVTCLDPKCRAQFYKDKHRLKREREYNSDPELYRKRARDGYYRNHESNIQNKRNARKRTRDGIAALNALKELGIDIGIDL
jgi:hypothetical protein